jgi:ATP-dependent RNA helicase SUPV3L1/SUV3
VAHRRRGLFEPASLSAIRSTAAAVPGLTRALPAVDQQALEHLSRYPGDQGPDDASERVEKLWEACALPDYRRITPAQHADLISTLYTISSGTATVNEDFMAEQVCGPIAPTARSTRFRRESLR